MKSKSSLMFAGGLEELTLRETRARYPHTSGFILFKVLASVNASSASLRSSSYAEITHTHTSTHTNENKSPPV